MRGRIEGLWRIAGLRHLVLLHPPGLRSIEANFEQWPGCIMVHLHHILELGVRGYLGSHIEVQYTAIPSRLALIVSRKGYVLPGSMAPLKPTYRDLHELTIAADVIYSATRVRGLPETEGAHPPRHTTSVLHVLQTSQTYWGSNQH